MSMDRINGQNTVMLVYISVCQLHLQRVVVVDPFSVYAPNLWSLTRYSYSSMSQWPSSSALLQSVTISHELMQEAGDGLERGGGVPPHLPSPI